MLDYSPTAALAAQIAKIPTVAVGNGFALPLATTLLPTFPGFSWARAARATESERRVAAAGLGVSLCGGETATSIADRIRRLTQDAGLRARVGSFAQRAMHTELGEIASIVLGEGWFTAVPVHSGGQQLAEASR
jgi:hypothetical protein